MSLIRCSISMHAKRSFWCDCFTDTADYESAGLPNLSWFAILALSDYKECIDMKRTMVNSTVWCLMGLLLVCILLLSSCASLASPYASETLVSSAEGMQEFIVTTYAEDGFQLQGKLRLPATGEVEALVIYVNGSGPNTYDNKRSLGETTFNYHDFFAQRFTDNQVAYFSYNTRGANVDENPPLFTVVDEELYKAYTVQSSVSDIAHWARLLSKDSRIGNKDIVLLGWSEGAIIAVRVVLQEDVPIKALVLAGLPVDSMKTIMEWQLGGENSIRFYQANFDMNGDGCVSRLEFDSDPHEILVALGNPNFSDLDCNADEVLTAEDFKLLLAPYREMIFDAIERDDNVWLKENYGVQLTSNWFKSHAAIPSNFEMIPQLSLPVYVFQGEADANVPVQRVLDLASHMQELGKTNFHVQVFPSHDHDLNFLLYPLQQVVSEGLSSLVDQTIDIFSDTEN
ncbi:MAG: alpha/beta hydrolase [Sphaerochaeta sp.]